MLRYGLLFIISLVLTAGIAISAGHHIMLESFTFMVLFASLDWVIPRQEEMDQGV